MRWSKKAQSTLEYIVVLAAVMGALIVLANKAFKSAITNGLDTVANRMEKSLK